MDTGLTRLQGSLSIWLCCNSSALLRHQDFSSQRLSIGGSAVAISLLQRCSAPLRYPNNRSEQQQHQHPTEAQPSRVRSFCPAGTRSRGRAGAGVLKHCLWRPGVQILSLPPAAVLSCAARGRSPLSAGLRSCTDTNCSTASTAADTFTMVQPGSLLHGRSGAGTFPINRVVCCRACASCPGAS